MGSDHPGKRHLFLALHGAGSRGSRAPSLTRTPPANVPVEIAQSSAAVANSCMSLQSTWTSFRSVGARANEISNAPKSPITSIFNLWMTSCHQKANTRPFQGQGSCGATASRTLRRPGDRYSILQVRESCKGISSHAAATSLEKPTTAIADFSGCPIRTSRSLLAEDLHQQTTLQLCLILP